MRTALVTGASGFLGRHVLPFLAARGWRVRAMVRREAAARELAGDGVETVLADLTDPASLERAVEGQSAVVHLAGAADASRAEINQAVNAGGMRNLLAACARVGVAPRFLFFSTHCVARPLRDAYARSKLEAESALETSGLRWVIFRPAMIYGEGSAEFRTFVRAVRRLPWVPIPGDGQALVRPSFVDDVLPAVAAALERSEALGQRYEICGPAPVTFDRLVALVAGELGLVRRVLHVPGGLALAGARLLGRLARRPPITVDQVLGFLQDTLADPAPAARDLGFAPRPIAEGLAALFRRHPPAMW